MQDKVYHVSLSEFSIANSTDRGNELLLAKYSLPKREQQEQALAKFDEITGWLWAIAQPVLDSIDFARYKPGRHREAMGELDGDVVDECAPELRRHASTIGFVSTDTTSIRSLSYTRVRSALLSANRLALSAPVPQTNFLVAIQFTPRGDEQRQ